MFKRNITSFSLPIADSICFHQPPWVGHILVGISKWQEEQGTSGVPSWVIPSHSAQGPTQRSSPFPRSGSLKSLGLWKGLASASLSVFLSLVTSPFVCGKNPPSYPFLLRRPSPSWCWAGYGSTSNYGELLLPVVFLTRISGQGRGSCYQNSREWRLWSAAFSRT